MFRGASNHALYECGDDEVAAFRVAWGAVKRRYAKVNGDWMPVLNAPSTHSWPRPKGTFVKLVSYCVSGLRHSPRGGILLGDVIVDLARGFEHVERIDGRPCAESDVASRYGHGIRGLVERQAVARPAAERLVAWHEAGLLPMGCIVARNQVTLHPPLPRSHSMNGKMTDNDWLHPGDEVVLEVDDFGGLVDRTTLEG
jgi:hypothetical protein